MNNERELGRVEGRISEINNSPIDAQFLRDKTLSILDAQNSRIQSPKASLKIEQEYAETLTNK